LYFSGSVGWTAICQ